MILTLSECDSPESKDRDRSTFQKFKKNFESIRAPFVNEIKLVFAVPRRIGGNPCGPAQLQGCFRKLGKMNGELLLKGGFEPGEIIFGLALEENLR